MLGTYYGQRCLDNTFNCIKSPLEAMQQRSSNVKFAKGCEIGSDDKSGFAEAINLAKSSDIAILFVGMNQSSERETHDRIELTLPGIFM